MIFFYLFWNFRKGYLDVVKELVRLGADVNLQNSFYTTPLIRAAKDNQLPVVRWLVQNTCVNINHKNKWQETALSAAAKRTNWEIAQYLLETCPESDVSDLEPELMEKINNVNL